jgi:hypothetical protein
MPLHRAISCCTRVHADALSVSQLKRHKRRAPAPLSLALAAELKAIGYREED